MITIRTYKLNCQRNVVNKTIGTTTAYNLVIVSTLYGNFKNAVALKNPIIDIDITNDSNKFNYVYIVELERYYFVEKIDLVSKDIIRVSLVEDVLMSHASLILEQNAYVTRYENAVNNDLLIDDRLPREDVPTITYIEPTTTPAVTNIIDFDFDNINNPNILLVTRATVSDITTVDKIYPPNEASELPTISGAKSVNDHYYLINRDTYNKLITANIHTATPESYIQSILFLPFNLLDIFPDAYNTDSHIYAGDYYLMEYNEINWDHLPISSSYTPIKTWETDNSGSPYIKVADFYFSEVLGDIPITDKYDDLSPNITQWEIYLPFVGWVQLTNVKDLYGDRIIVYYTFDINTGNSTVYVYNSSKEYVVYSSQCQIGIPLPTISTNVDSIARQQQATSLNTFMGLLTSALSIGVGVAGGNPLAIAGGVLSAGKTIVSTVNTLNSLIEHAQMTFGGSRNALYSPNKVTIRKIKHNAVSNTDSTIYGKTQGYPYRAYTSLTNLSGYIEVGDIQFNPKFSDIYNDEINEIVTLLKNGVIL